MNDETHYQFGDDFPKTNPWRQDRFGFKPVAKRIAETIIRLAAPNGYVIGLHGPWGSGKSTLINFVLAFLEKHDQEHSEDKITRIDFRPWIVSGHQDLVIAFFKLLSEKLDPQESRGKRMWKGAVSMFLGNADQLVDATAAIAVVIDPSSGMLSGFAKGLAKTPIHSLISRFLETPSLQTAYERLRDQLARSKKRFLITIDDIDRLEDHDVKLIMQLVKSIGQLPNVVYLLSYDRDIVWNVLDQRANKSGPRYAEKIIQHEIELPAASRQALLSVLDQEIAFLLERGTDSTRWQYLLRDGIWRWMRSPRDVLRLANAVKFSWPAIGSEIDPQDLVVMEEIRLFDQGAYSWIRENRDFLFSDGRFLLATDDARRSAVDALKKRLPTEHADEVLRVLATLFPETAKWFAGDSNTGERHVEIMQRRGVGVEDGYDAYFALNLSSDAISRATIDELVDPASDGAAVEATLRAYLGRRTTSGGQLISKLLSELRARFTSRKARAPSESLFGALFGIGEDVLALDREEDVFSLSPRSNILFLIRDILGLWGMSEAGRQLVSAFESSTSPAILASVYVARGSELGLFPSSSHDRPIIEPATFDQLGKILRQKIEDAVLADTLGDAPFYWDIAGSWAQLTDRKTVKAWLSQGIQKSSDFMFKASKILISYSVGSGTRHYTMRDSYDADLFDLELLVEAGRKHLTEATLSPDQRALITEVVRGSQQLLVGRSAEGTREADDDG